MFDYSFQNQTWILQYYNLHVHLKVRRLATLTQLVPHETISRAYSDVTATHTEAPSSFLSLSVNMAYYVGQCGSITT